MVVRTTLDWYHGLMIGWILVLSLSGLAAAQPGIESGEGWQRIFNGKNLDGWGPQDSSQPFEWRVVAKAFPEPSRPKRMAIMPLSAGREGLLANGAEGKSANIVTTQEHGDLELYLEFMIPKGSNSGVYLQGLYEIQILDSFGKPDHELKFGDCGGVYARWIEKKSVGGHPPRVNASRAPGEWQSFHIWFRAPRFDESGKKVEEARFLKVLHNGVVVHEDVPLSGPTRAHMPRAESRRGPLMLQGDHGPVAYRNIRWRPLP